MKKIILLAALVAGTASVAVAGEKARLGVRAGLNFDSQTVSGGGTSETSDSKFGFHLGAVVDVPLASCAAALPEWLYFQPGLYFTTKGGKWDARFIKNTTSLYYLELPLLVSAKLSLTDNLKVRADFGPSIGFAVGGKTKVGSFSGKVFDNDKTRRFNFGLDFGLGVEYRQLYIGAGYDLGLTSMRTDNSLKNRTFSISLGYNF